MLGQLDTFIAFAAVILGLSLLITVLNQLVIALLALRGTHLRWGLTNLLEHVDPRLAPHAATIAGEVLRHPLVSDSTMSRVAHWPGVGVLVARWKLASAIRVEELVNVLRKMAVQPPTPPGALVPEPEAGNWRQLLWLALAENDRQAQVRLADAARAVEGLGPAVQAQMATLAPQVLAQMSKARGDVELWFDWVMDRVSQRFAVRMRMWTVIWAIVVAFVLHVDASQLLRQISANPELRSRLVASTDLLTRQASAVLENSGSDVNGRALVRLATESSYTAVPPGGAFVTRSAALAWLQQQMPGVEPTEVRRRLDAAVQAEVDETLERLGGQTRELHATLQQVGLQIVPNYAEHRRKGDRWPDWWIYTEADRAGAVGWNEHFFGVLFSALLLSLGAPFWFKALQTAATLRPVLASRERAEREQKA